MMTKRGYGPRKRGEGHQFLHDRFRAATELSSPARSCSTLRQILAQPIYHRLRFRHGWIVQVLPKEH